MIIFIRSLSHPPLTKIKTLLMIMMMTCLLWQLHVPKGKEL